MPPSVARRQGSRRWSANETGEGEASGTRPEGARHRERGATAQGGGGCGGRGQGEGAKTPPPGASPRYVPVRAEGARERAATPGAPKHIADGTRPTRADARSRGRGARAMGAPWRPRGASQTRRHQENKKSRKPRANVGGKGGTGGGALGEPPNPREPPPALPPNIRACWQAPPRRGKRTRGLPICPNVVFFGGQGGG